MRSLPKRSVAALLAALLLFTCAFADTVSPAFTGEVVEIADELTQEWYDEMYDITANYVVEPGVRVGNALRIKGQETLDEVEIEVMNVMEGISLDENDMISSEGMINIILLGIDARPRQLTGRSDCMILCSVDTNKKTIKMISFMRDMYVNIPNHAANRLNTAFYYEGPELLKETLKKNFGVTFDHYIAVNYSILADLIDQLGGLEINVEDDFFMDRINAVIKMDNKELGNEIESGLVEAPGVQILNGQQAQAYARFRYGAKSGGDFGRTGRQREVIMKIFEKVVELPATSMIGLAVANLDNVSTDLTLPDLVKLAPTVLALKDAEFEELRVPGDGEFQSQTVNGMSVLVPDTNRIVKSIKAFLED